MSSKNYAIFFGARAVHDKFVPKALSAECLTTTFSYIHCIYFSLTAMGKLVGSRGFSGAAHGHIGGSFIGEKAFIFP